MIGSVRNVLKSGAGKVVAIGFVGLIAVAFAASDLSNQSASFGDPTGQVLAKVGGNTLTTGEMQRRLSRAFENMRQQNPGLTMDQFLAQGAIDAVYDELVSALALDAYAEKYGIRPSKAQIDAEIASNPAFQDAAGKFSQTVYTSLLAREGISERDMRNQVRQQLILRQVLLPAAQAATPASGVARPYAGLLLEAREGRIAAFPSGSFVSGPTPTDAQIAAFYAANKAMFTLPESRKLRYAVIERAAIAARQTPTDAEILAYYNANKAEFAARERRTIRQLVLPTEAAARDVARKVAGGKSLFEAAQEAGLAVNALNDVQRTDLAKQAGEAVATAAFSAAQGKLAGPVRGSLGWQVLFVEAVNAIPAQSVEQARAIITPIVAERKVADALSALTSRIDDMAADGSTLDDIAKANGLTVAETPFLTADGRVLDGDPSQANPALNAVLKDAFGMDVDSDPQIATLVPDQSFALIDVTDIRASAPAPLERIKPQVAQAFQLAEGRKKAEAAIARVKSALGQGQSFEAAIAATGVALPPVDPVQLRRIDIARMGGQVPPAIGLMFSMKQGTAKSMPIPNNQGFLLIYLDKIVSTDPGQVPQLIEQTRTQIGNAMGTEYGLQLRRAIEGAVGTERRPEALAAFAAAFRKGTAPAE